MSSLESVLDIARRSLSVSQTNLQVISNNIANVNTPGYTRQRAILEPEKARLVSGTILGNGVRVADVRRAFEQLSTTQLTSALGQEGLANTKSSLLGRVENLVNESVSAGLGQAMLDFFNTFQALASDPTNLGARGAVKQQGTLVATQFNSIYDQLTLIQKEANASVEALTDEVNRLAKQIGQLNSDILTQEVNGQAATLRDERDRSVEELAKLINITTFKDSGGSINVLVGGSNALVSSTTVSSLSLTDRTLGNLVVKDVNLTTSTGAKTLITSQITGGEMGANITVRDTLVPDYKNTLNELASTFRNEVNKQHKDGFGINGTTGTDFFTPLTVVNQAVTDKAGLSLIDSAGASNSNAASASIGSSTITDRATATGESYDVRFGFVIATGVNDTLRVQESNGSAAVDTITLSANLTGATGVEIASDLQTQLNASGTLNGTYAVTYNSTAGTFNVAIAGGLNVTFDNSVGTADETLGFTSNPAAGVSVTSDSARVDDALYTVINTTDSPDTVVGTANQAYTSGSAIAFEGVSTVVSSRNDSFQVKAGSNDKLVFAAGGGNITLTLTAGSYTGDELATELKTRLEADNGNSDTYTVSFDETTNKFTIANAAGSANTLTLRFSNAGSTAAQMLAFDTNNDDAITAGSSGVSDTATGGPQAGDLFSIQAVRDSAFGMKVNASIVNDLNLIAVAGGANAAGDNRNALAISSIQTANVTNGGKSTLNQFYSSLVGEIGSETRGAKANLTFQNGIVEQLQARRKQGASVSLDEEFISLIKFERSFQAAARLISAVDRMMEILLTI